MMASSQGISSKFGRSDRISSKLKYHQLDQNRRKVIQIQNQISKRDFKVETEFPHLRNRRIQRRKLISETAISFPASGYSNTESQ
jgi:ribosomal protein S8